MGVPKRTFSLRNLHVEACSVPNCGRVRLPGEVVSTRQRRLCGDVVLVGVIVVFVVVVVVVPLVLVVLLLLLF